MNIESPQISVTTDQFWTTCPDCGISYRFEHGHVCYGPSGTGAYTPMIPSTAAQPWICPRCRTVNAPHVDQCSCDPDKFYP